PVHDRDRHRAEDGPRSRHPCDHGPRASVGPRRRGEGPRWSCGGVVVKRLGGKVAWVTGSSRGIGAAIARLFAREGALVAVHGRDPEALSAVHAEIEKEGGRAIAVAGDLTKFAEVEAIRQQIERDLGAIDILVANAGGSFTPPGPLEDTPEDVAQAALFLASEEASWITGVILDVTGGAVMV